MKVGALASATAPVPLVPLLRFAAAIAQDEPSTQFWPATVIDELAR